MAMEEESSLWAAIIAAGFVHEMCLVQHRSRHHTDVVVARRYQFIQYSQVIVAIYTAAKQVTLIIYSSTQCYTEYINILLFTLYISHFFNTAFSTC